MGYPVFTQDSLPIDDDIVGRLFGAEVEAGEIDHPMSISDVWKNSYSENTSRKIWAAKYIARHPNLVALELSRLQVRHDAPHLFGGGRDCGALRHAGISASRTSTRISRPARFASASKPSRTSSSATAKT